MAWFGRETCEPVTMAVAGSQEEGLGLRPGSGAAVLLKWNPPRQPGPLPWWTFLAGVSAGPAKFHVVLEGAGVQCGSL